MFVILKTKFVGQLLRFLLTATYFHGPDICVNIFNRISRPNKKYYTQERSKNCCLRHSHCAKNLLSQSPCLLLHVLYLVAKPTFIFRGKPSFSCHPTVRNEWDFLSISQGPKHSSFLQLKWSYLQFSLKLRRWIIESWTLRLYQTKPSYILWMHSLPLPRVVLANAEETTRTE